MHEKLTTKPYIIGFALSLILTFAAYVIVVFRASLHLSIEMIIGSILVFAIIQLFVQLYFFLHLGREEKPRWNLAVFVSFAGMILLIVIASLWIMTHLNYNMSPTQMEKKLIQDEGIQEMNMQRHQSNVSY